MIRIRTAHPEDGTEVVALWTQGYVTEGEGGRSEPYVEEDFDETVRRGRVFVAEVEDVVVGIVAIFAPGTPGLAVAAAGEAELSRLSVVASARRDGIGDALVRRCIELARAEGWPAIALWSRGYQTAAHRLYESRGFQRVPARDAVDETGHARLVFRLDLRAHPRIGRMPPWRT